MTTSKAAAIGAGYFAAWSAGNVGRATEYLTDDVEIIAPNGRFSGRPGYHEFMDGFARMLTGVTEFTIFGDDTTALIWYTTHLQPVPSLTAGERISLGEDKIARIEIVFDQMPLAQAFRRSAGRSALLVLCPVRDAQQCCLEIGALPCRPRIPSPG
jgi:SnoaL-like protein